MNKQVSAVNEIEKMIKKKDYDSAIKALKQEIERIFAEKVSKNNSSCKCTNMLSLINTSENILSKKDYTLLKKYYFIITENNCAEYELYQLMNIFSDLKEVKK